MRLSMASSGLLIYRKDGTDLYTLLKALRDCGFGCVDFSITDDMLEGDWEARAIEVRGILASLDLEAAQAHAPMPNPLDPSAGIDCVAVQSRALRFCGLAGIPRVVVHPGARPGNDRAAFFDGNIAFYRALIPAAEETGVRVLIENIGNYADPYFLWTGADLREMIDRVGHPLFGACWDVGHAHHFWPEDGTQYDSIMALGDKLEALHIHDNGGYFDDAREHHRVDMHSVPYFSLHSLLSFDEVLQALKDVGYRGTFNFESKFPGEKVYAKFVYHGQESNKLRKLPLSLWQKFNAAVHDMGKYMLETYDMYDA